MKAVPQRHEMHTSFWFFYSLTKHYLPWIKDGVETASPSANHSNSVRVMATIHAMFNLTS